MAEVTALADLPDIGAVHLLFYLVAHLPLHPVVLNCTVLSVPVRQATPCAMRQGPISKHTAVPAPPQAVIAIATMPDYFWNLTAGRLLQGIGTGVGGLLLLLYSEG